MKRLLLPATATLALLSAGCGAAEPEAVVLPERASATLTTPPPALAAGTLGSLADVPAGHRRIGFVNPAKLASFGGALKADEVASLVLGGTGAARLDDETPPPAAAVQVGTATVLAGAERIVLGGTPALRDQLGVTMPQSSLITDETPSAVQSCLGDGAAEVIVGSAVLGRSSAIGAALLDSADAPAGRKLLVCAAPHFARDLDKTIARLEDAFDDATLPAARRPQIREADIGERDIVAAAISADEVDPATLRDLLRGGDALTALAGA